MSKQTTEATTKKTNEGDWGYIYDLTRAQEQFVYDFTHRYVGMGGGWFNGKTYALCRKHLLLLDLIPGIKILLLQVTEGQLKRSLIPEFARALMGHLATPDDLKNHPAVRRWSKGDLILEFKGGSQVDFVAFGEATHGVSQVGKMQSATYGAVGVDQADQMNQDTFFYLRGRNRQRLMDRHGKQLHNYFSLNYNPEAYTHWIYQCFIRKNKEFVRDTGHMYKTYEFSSRQGGLADEEKLKEFEGMPEHLAKRFAEGKWGAFGDMLYKDFDPDIHIIPPFNVPADWRHYLVFDYGFTHESCFHLYAESTRCEETPDIPEGYLFLIWEHYQAQWTTREHINVVGPRIDKINLVNSWCDPAIFNVRSDGKSIGDDYADYGIMFSPADNAQMRGVIRTMEMLQARPERYSDAVQILEQRYGELEFIPGKMLELTQAPRLFIFNGQAPNAVEEIPSVRASEQRYGQNTFLVNVKKDHAADCLRYMCNQYVESTKGEERQLTTAHWKRVLERKRKNRGVRVA